MRPVLTLALVLAVLALALRLAPDLEPREEGPRLADRALELVAAGHGTMLPLARPAGRTDEYGDVIRVGDRVLVGDGRDGVRAVLATPGVELLDERHFDVRTAKGARGLRAVVEAARPGQLLALATTGDLRPEDAAAGDDVRAALLSLGATARLGATAPESWALLALRGPAGWVPLSEAWSDESGVAVTFLLSPDLDAAGFRGDVARVRADERGELELAPELARADTNVGVRAAPDASARGRVLPGLALRPVPDPRTGTTAVASVRWDRVPVAPGAGFIAWLAAPDGAARLELVVDGEVAGELAVVPGAPWRVFLVDLRAFAGRTVSLELRARAAADAPTELLVGRPMLLRGYDRSPLEVWAER